MILIDFDLHLMIFYFIYEYRRHEPDPSPHNLAVNIVCESYLRIFQFSESP